MRGPNETKIHQRHETLTAGKRARLIAELRHQAQRFIDGSRIMVIKFCRFHSSQFMSRSIRHAFPKQLLYLLVSIVDFLCQAAATPEANIALTAVSLATSTA